MSALRKATAEDAPALARVMARVNQLTQSDLEELGAWSELCDLSTQTELEMIDTGPDNIVFDNSGGFEAVADVYVTLNYGSSDDDTSFSDGYLATIRGRLDGEEVIIDTVSVDVSSFYE